MGFATAPDGSRVAYEASGTGPPVLLVPGLALDIFRWWRVAAWLETAHEAIRFHNRGTGRSEPPVGRVSVEELAKDATAVLDAAGRRTVAVLGASLGGLVALELALSHPDRVSALVLLCTLPGGDNSIRPARAVRSALARHYESAEDLYRQCASIVYASHTLQSTPESVDEDIANAGPMAPERVWRQQYEAAAQYEAWTRLPDVRAPTLVVTGSDDRVVPPGNSEVIAARVTGARLERLTRAGHRLDADAPEELRRLLTSFLQPASPSKSGGTRR